MTSYGKTTYSELIDSALSDVNEHEALADLSREAMQVHILRAEQYICEQTAIKEEYIVRMADGVYNYPVQDRPVLTDASNATPIAVRQPSHGFSTDDIVTIVNVQGNLAANGRKRITVTDSDNYTLSEFARVINASNESVITITTEYAHGLTSGETKTITGVLGNTAANGTFVITVTETNAFTIPIAGNGDYTSGGFVVWDAAGNGAYTGGGRAWREDEIPTFLKDIRVASRTLNNLNYEVSGGSDIHNIVQRSTGWQAVFPNTPNAILETGAGLRKYWRFYPTPVAAGDVTLYGFLRINPVDYFSEEITSTIHLSSEWNPTIVEWLKEKMYRHLKDKELAREAKAESERLKEKQIIASAKPSMMRVDYK